MNISMVWKNYKYRMAGAAVFALAPLTYLFQFSDVPESDEIGALIFPVFLVAEVITVASAALVAMVLSVALPFQVAGLDFGWLFQKSEPVVTPVGDVVVSDADFSDKDKVQDVGINPTHYAHPLLGMSAKDKTVNDSEYAPEHETNGASTLTAS